MFRPGLFLRSATKRVSTSSTTTTASVAELAELLDGVDVLVLAADWPPCVIGRWANEAAAEVIETVDRMMSGNNPIGAAAALRGRAERPDYRPRLRALELPAFICAGTADRFSTAAVTAELIDCLPRATTLILPEVGHMPNLEAPHRFNEGLVEFLRRHAAPEPLPQGS
jgi:pimeloyl-ACP methyl ester carboxylesterase